MKRNMPKCKKHVQLVQRPEKMRAGLIIIFDNEYTVLELLSSFASASTTRTVTGTPKKRVSSS